MRVFSRLFVAAISLLAAASLAQNKLVFSGTVYAVPNSNLQGSVVIACLLEHDACNQSRSRAVQVTASGASAAFQLVDLEAASYLLLAWRDLNGNGEADAGDELAVYARNGKPALLQPPAVKLELRLQAFTGDFDALLAGAATPSPAPSAPSVAPASGTNQALLIGEFSSLSTSMFTYVNPSTGLYAPPSGNAMSYIFKPGGAFEQMGLLQSTVFSCTQSFFVDRTGTYAVNGATLTLTYLQGTVTFRDSCYSSSNKVTKAKLDAARFTWRVEVDSALPGQTRLYLTDSKGEVSSYLKVK